MASFTAQSPKLSQGLWENPCLSIFNHISIDQFHRAKKQGDVKSLLDNHIGKRVFSIRGLVSLNSFIEIPNPGALYDVFREPINARGPFVYIQYRRIPSSPSTPLEKSIVMFHIDIVTNNGPLRLSVSSLFEDIKLAGHALRIPLNPSHNGRWTIFALDIPKLLKHNVSKTSEYKLLQSLKLCANMVVRDVFTSNQAYVFTNMPQEMRLPCRGSDWEDEYSWSWCPEPPAETRITSPVRIEAPRFVSSPSPTFKQPTSIIDHTKSSKLGLSQIIGLGCHGLCWRGDRVLFPAGHTLVLFYSNAVQSMCCYHTSTITSAIFSHDGNYMLSGQKNGHVNLWHVGGKCFWHEKCDLVAASFSSCDSNVLIASKDAHHRFIVSLWNVRDLKRQRATTALICRHTGDLSINEALFFPSDKTAFITCGEENIRHWRLHKGKLQNSSFIGDAGRGLTFSALCFSKENSERLYAATSSGWLLVVDVRQRKVVSSFGVHDSPISCVKNAGNNIITSDNRGRLRVWSTDFDEYLMQACYESSIKCLAVNEDASKVVTATAHGCLGMLDLSTQKYCSLVQCHQTGVNALVTTGRTVVTTGADATLRLIEEGIQVAEFHIDSDVPSAVAVCNSTKLVACGYASGVVRIVSVASSSSIHELNGQGSPIVKLAYYQQVLYSLASDGTLALHNVEEDFKHMKQLTLKEGTFCFDVNKEKIAVASFSKNAYALDVYDVNLSDYICSLDLPPQAKPLSVSFSSNYNNPPYLLVLTSKSLLKYIVHNISGHVKGQVVFRLSSQDVKIVDVNTSGVVWCDPKTSHVLLRSPNGGLFKLLHSPPEIRMLSLSSEMVVAADDTGSLFCWERFVKSTALESFDSPSQSRNNEWGDQSRLFDDFNSTRDSANSMIDLSHASLVSSDIDSSTLSFCRVLGYEGSRMNIVWDSSEAIIAFSMGHILVLQSTVDPDKQLAGTQCLNITTLCLCGNKLVVGCVASHSHASFGVWKFAGGLSPELSLLRSSHLHDATGVEMIVASHCLCISLGFWNDNLKCLNMIFWSRTFKMISSHQIHNKVTGLSFFPCQGTNQDVERFATAEADGIKMWKLDGKNQLHSTGCITSTIALSVSVLNDHFMIYGDSRGCLNLWNFDEQKIVECYTVSERGEGVSTISSSKAYVFASTECGEVKSFETSSGHLICTGSQSLGSTITSLEQEKTSGSSCLVGTRDGALFVMSHKEKEVLRLAGSHMNASYTKFVGGDRLLLTASRDDGSLRCWDSALNRVVFHLQTNPPSKCVAFTVTQSSSRGLWCCISTDSGQVRIFDLIQVSIQKEFSLLSPVSHMSSFGENLLCGCVDGSLILVKLSDSHQMFEVGGIPGMVIQKLESESDSSTVLALVKAPNGDSHVLIWDSGQDILTLKNDVLLLGDIEDAIVCPWDTNSLVILSSNEQGSLIEVHPRSQQMPVSKQFDFCVSSMICYGDLLAIGTLLGEVKVLNMSLEVVADCLAHRNSSINPVSLTVARNRLASFTSTQLITWELVGGSTKL